MLKKSISLILFLSISLLISTNTVYSYYPFCEDVNIIYYGSAGSLLEKWALIFREELKKRFDFRDKVQVSASRKLGIKDVDINKAFNDKKLDIAIVPASKMIDTVPSFRTLTFPGFVAKDYEIKLLQSKRQFLNRLENDSKNLGVPLLGVGWRFRTLTSTSTKPIKSVYDLKGRKIRVSYAEQGTAIAAFGGTGIHIPFADATIALKEGVIDGMMSSFSYSIELAKQEVIKSVIHFESGGFDSIAYVMIMRNELFQKTDHKARRNIKKAAKIAKEEFTLLSMKEREDVITTLEKIGIKINILDDEQYKNYQNEIFENVWPKLKRYDQIKNMIELRNQDIK